MKTFVVGLFLATLVTVPAFADYWVVLANSGRCEILEARPITGAGTLLRDPGYRDRADAEKQVNELAECRARSASPAPKSQPKIISGTTSQSKSLPGPTGAK